MSLTFPRAVLKNQLASASPLAVLVFFVCLGAWPASAQGYAQAGMDGAGRAVPQVLNLENPARGCPVSMYARQGGFGDVMRVRNGSAPAKAAVPQAGQRIHLVVQSPAEDRTIVSARAVVRGTSPKVRSLPTSFSEQAKFVDQSRTLDLSFVREEGGEGADLALPEFTSVTSITLKSIAYSDGSSWKSSDQARCRTAPDPRMLVGLR